ncbi:MAG: lamin tail domain-containing protein, partial [Verrucomicrobia bacterium]|nr:lamin tail domain-containing protein [Verrucomicrobiota bacterium]
MLQKLAILSALLCLHFSSPAQTVSDIAHLRTLVDTANFLPTDTTNLYTVTGVVTTHVSLTDLPNVLVHVQDNSAGIALFWNGGANNFVPAAGDTIQVTAPLGHASGLLELRATNSNPTHAVLLMSTGDALPEPTSLEFKWKNDAATIETQEGKFVVASNVFVDVSSPLFTADSNVTITNANGDTFTVRIDGHTDITGQPKPADAVTILGVLSQSDSSNPRTSGYQLVPTRFADILSASKAPAIRFTNVLENLIRPGDQPTNTFTELVLHAGERLTINAAITDAEGNFITIVPLTNNLPATAEWDIPADTGTDLTATFTFAPITTDGGENYVVALQAFNDVATNTMTWMVYVPVGFEQRIIVSEFLANPTANTNLAFFNPLHRSPASTKPTTEDEFIELVNLSATDVQLQGWTIADAAQVRHRFTAPFLLQSSNAVVVYGGPTVGFQPQLDVPAFPASVSSAGLSLNNTGTEMILIRNARSNLIARVVYAGSDLSANGSIARAPTLDSAFVPQTSVSPNAATPGRQYDGRLFSQFTVVPPRPPEVRFTNVLANLIRPGDAGTNSFTEHAVRPGETLTMQVSASDPDGNVVSVAPVVNGLP